MLNTLKFDRIGKELRGHPVDAGHDRGRHDADLHAHHRNRARPRLGGLYPPGGHRGHALGHRAGDLRRGLRGAGFRLLFLPAAIHIPHHGSARSRQSGFVHLRRGGGEPSRDPAQTPIGSLAPARDRSARSLRLFAPAGGGVRRVRHSRRHRRPPRRRHAAQSRAVRQCARGLPRQRAARRCTVPKHVRAEVAECCGRPPGDLGLARGRNSKCGCRQQRRDRDRQQRRHLVDPRGVAQEFGVRRHRDQFRPRVAGKLRRVAHPRRRGAVRRHRDAGAAGRRARHQRGPHAFADRTIARGA